MRRLLIRMSFAAVGEGGRTRTSGPVLETGSVATSLTPSFSKSDKKPGLSRVWCAMRKMHSDPQKTTLLVTRFQIVLAIPSLEVFNDTSRHPSINAITCGAPGRTRTCVYFVRSEGHPSALARALKSLVGELRIELSPRAPKARMQTHYTIPRLVPAQRVERCSLRFQRSISTAHTRLAKSGGPSRLCPDHLRIASAALCLNEL